MTNAYILSLNTLQMTEHVHSTQMAHSKIFL